MSQKKSFPFGLVFIISVFVFAAWVYLYEYRGEEKRGEAKAKASALLPFSNADVREISIRARPGGVPTAEFVETKLLKDASSSLWKVETPYKDLADATVVDSFLSALSIETVQETVLAGEASSTIQWSTYGLDQPAASITLKAVKDGTEIERVVAIGSVPAFDGSVYARLDGVNSVVTMSSNVIATLQKEAREFRDKRFFSDAKFPEFSGLQVLRPGFPKIDLVLKDGVWVERDARPGAWPLDQGIVKAYIDGVSGLRGNDVWAEDKTLNAVLISRRLNKPGLEIVLTVSGSVTDVAKVKSPLMYRVKLASLVGEQTVAAGFGSEKPLVFSVYKAQIENLTKSIDDFRDLKFPFQFKLDQVQAIELERAQGAVSLPNVVRREKTWALDPMDTRFTGREVRSEAVDALLTEILTLQARRLTPSAVSVRAPRPKVSDRGAVRVGLFDLKNRPLVEFLFQSGDDMVRVTSSVVPNRILELEKSAFDRISFDVLTPPPQAAGEKEKK